VKMRLLTHNFLRNHAGDAKGKGFPLKISAADIRVEEEEHDGAEQGKERERRIRREIAFVKGMLPTLDWDALVEAATDVGIPTLPPALSDKLVEDPNFAKALYHVLMRVHVVRGTLTCPATGRKFQIENEIPNMVLEDEDDCERVRY